MVLPVLFLNFLAVSFLLIIIGALGSRLLSLVFPYPMAVTERTYYGLALGLGAVAYAVFAMGLLGLYQPFFFFLLIVILLAVSWWRFSGVGTFLTQALGVVAELFREIGSLPKIVWGGVALMLLIAGLSIGAPATAGDDLFYYLLSPKTYLAVGRLVEWIPGENSNLSLVPGGGVMLFTLTYGLGGELFVSTFGFLTVVIAATALVLMFRLLLGLRVAVLGGMIFLTTPIVALHLSSPRFDFLLFFYSILAMSAIYRALSSPEKYCRWMVLSGICLGLGMTVKNTEIVLLALVIAALLGLRLLRIPGRYPQMRGLLFLGIAALLTSLPWYIRSWWWTGNPIWPFFSPMFSALGLKVFPPQWGDLDWGTHIKPVSYYLSLPWVLTLDLSTSGGSSAAFLAYLPLLFALNRERRLLPYWLVFCTLFVIAVGHMAYHFRYSMPVIGGLSLITAYVMEVVVLQFPFPWMAKLNRTFLSMLAIIALFMTSRGDLLRLPVVLGLETTPHFLSRANFNEAANGIENISQTDMIGALVRTTHRSIFSESVQFFAPPTADFIAYHGQEFSRRSTESSVKVLENGQAKYLVQAKGSELLKDRHLNAKLLYDSRGFEILSIP